MTAAKLGSMLFYAAIAAVTVVMARKVQGQSEQGLACETAGSGLTRRSFQNRLYLAGIFTVLFLSAALRFDIGNDYKQYTQTAHEAYVGGYVVTEVGFNWLVKALYTIMGGEYYEVIFAVFAFATLVLFLKALSRQSSDFAMSYFLFVTLGLYFQTYNTMRYYLALAIALYAMRYCLRRELIPFVGWILIAALFHKSVLLTIPVYWIASYRWKRWQVIAILGISALCYLVKGPMLQLALYLYPSYENTIYLEGGTSVLSIVRAAAVLAFWLWFVRRGYETALSDTQIGREIRCYVQLTYLTIIACVFFSFLPVVTRIAYYFSVFQLLLIPLLISHIPEESVRKKAKILVFIVCIGYFLLFLWTADQPGVGLLPYRSWLFTAERYVYK